MAWVGGKTTSNSELGDLISRGFSQFLPARVLSIDQSDGLTNGRIVTEILTPLATLPNQKQIIASPLYPNIKSYPLVNEVVLLLPAPSGDYSSNSGNIKYYYLSTLNLWDNVHVNPTPNPYQNLNSNSQNKSIAEIEAGSINKSGEQDTNDFKPGTYFQEKSNIYPLYPFEGDIIYEGRWGNSIRFGSTNINVTGGNKIINKSNSFGAREKFGFGVSNPLNINSQLSVLSSRVKQFTNKYDNVTIITTVKASESRVTNPNNIPPGGLAKQRLENALSILSSYPLINKDIRSQSIIGSTPYTRGVDNPNDPKYLAEQYVSISVSVRGTETTSEPESEIPLNTWSTIGNAGDPILIFRNGQNPELTSPAQNTTIEDINKDLSSIYFTSTQKIPIEVSSQNDYLSYGNNKPEAPNEYKGAQVIVNSERLLFNSTKSDIMLSSLKSINLNSLEGIYTDTTGDTVFQSNRVYLGGTNNSQPVILGDELVSLLTDVLNDLSSLTKSIQNQVGVPAGTPLAPTNLVAQTIALKVPGYKQRLKNSLSQTTKTV